MRPSPRVFDGRFSKFFEVYVLPNLPSVERVQEFDVRLRSYLSGQDPCYPIRAVSDQTRGVICTNGHGCRMLPTDNAPVWWLHAFLSSSDPFPENDADLFENLPSHMFRLPKGRSYLPSAGYHAAHLVNAKNRDINWQSWSRKELHRRTLVNIHPCNMVLVAKTEWRRWGGSPDILEWTVGRYIERYGQVMKSFLSDAGELKLAQVESPGEIFYHYQERMAKLRDDAASVPRARSETTKILSINRPMIRDDLVGKRVHLEITSGEYRYSVPHDLLLDWVRANTRALQTRSWLERGIYSWPIPSRRMAAFLQTFKI